MPNHVRNVLKFKNLKPDDIEIIVNMIATPMDRPEGYSSYAIDFNKIIPEPKLESECPDEFKVNKDSHCEILKDKPWFDWYKWRLFYWDTKWGAYDCYSIIGKSYITFVFSTAWSIAYPIIERLTLLGYEFKLRYADEDLGHNCGIISYEYDGVDGVKTLYHDKEDSFTNPTQWAKRLWEKY